MADRLKRNLILRTERMLLRPMTEKDMADGLAILLSSEVAKTYMLPDFPDRKDAEEMFMRLARMSASPDRMMYGMEMDGHIVGWIHAVDDSGETVEVGYAVNPSWQGRGCATEAMKAIIAELFRMGCERVSAAYFEGNAASRRVMEKCGMKESGKTEEIEYRKQMRRCVYLEIKSDI